MSRSRGSFQAGDERTLAASRKGAARSHALHKARRPLDLLRVQEELPPLDSVENAQRRLDLIGLWTCAGLLKGMAASAAVRSCEAWLKAHEIGQTDEVTQRLRRELERLKGEMHGARRPAGGVPA